MNVSDLRAHRATEQFPSGTVAGVRESIPAEGTRQAGKFVCPDMVTLQKGAA